LGFASLLLFQSFYGSRFARVLKARHSLVHVLGRRVDPKGYEQSNFWKFEISPVCLLAAFFAEAIWSAPNRLTAIRALTRLCHNVLGDRTNLVMKAIEWFMAQLSRPPLWPQTEPAFCLGVRTLGQVNILREPA
jgi:hypothetical protein